MLFRGSEWRHCQASGKHSKFLCQQAFIEPLLHRGSTLSWDSRDPETWLLWVFRVYRDNRKTEKGVGSNLVEGANHVVPKGFQVEGAFGSKRLPESGSLREMQVMGWRKGARGPEQQVQRLSANGLVQGWKKPLLNALWISLHLQPSLTGPAGTRQGPPPVV